MADLRMLVEPPPIDVITAAEKVRMWAATQNRGAEWHIMGVCSREAIAVRDARIAELEKRVKAADHNRRVAIELASEKIAEKDDEIADLEAQMAERSAPAIVLNDKYDSKDLETFKAKWNEMVKNVKPGMTLSEGRDLLAANGLSSDRSTMAQVSDLARSACDMATRCGMVLTVYQQPLKPLAMGHYTTVVAVRLARGMA